jgi:drug/metabolite transporter (DMT)-like permease
MKSFGHTTGWRGVAAALLAAVLFGVSTPLAKVLSPSVAPVLMAGLLYLGSGLGLGAFAWLRARRKGIASQEAALTRKDVPWLAVAILAGGVVGPVLLMWGLAKTPAASASLLLNLEGVLTALLAWFVFRENFDARIALGMVLIAGGGICLTTGRSPHRPGDRFAWTGCASPPAVANAATRRWDAIPGVSGAHSTPPTACNRLSCDRLP